MSEEEKKAIKRMQEVRAKNVHTFVDELDIILNLIQKQQEEIKLLKDQKQYVIDEYGNAIDEKQKEIENKDKMIDEMANDIYSTQIESNRYFKDAEEVKQYFEKESRG